MRRTTEMTILLVSITIGMILGAVSPVAAAEKSQNQKFIDALSADNIGWRVSAAQILGDKKDVSAVKPLIRMLKADRDYAARISAAVALAKIGDAKALRALRNASRRDLDKTVRTVARAAYLELKANVGNEDIAQNKVN